ncbi:MAG: hypothetical protein BWX54_02417 [Verrucomicrobia bacterium ADurb.Bin018]|nr:MAG: hypothetical protein BWX54_02417 [Verrucomicrobia bacterium ADurb.Bin018]
MMLRILESGTRSPRKPRDCGVAAAGALPAGRGATAAMAGAGAAWACSTSRAMMRPPGPLPRMPRKSSPFSCASLRATGDERGTPGASCGAAPDTLATTGAATAGAGAGAGAGGGGGAGGAAAGAAGCAGAAGAAACALAAISSQLSPGLPTTAISWPTTAEVPGPAMIFNNVPADGAS